VKLIWAYLAFDAYRAFAPLVGPLDAEDDARRYIVDQQVHIKLPGRPGIRAMVIRPRSPAPGAPGQAAGVASGAGAGRETPARSAALLELAIDPARNDAKEYAANGYVGVSASIERGRARPFVPYQNDGAEARAAIDWIAKQPWSDGRVAMVGEGYSGFTAWAAAAHAPAALKAIATSSPTAPGIDVPMSGNIFQNSAYRWSLWAANTKPSLDASFEDDAVWRALNEKWYRSGRPYRDFGSLHGMPDPIFLRWLNHPSYDRFWQTMIPFQEQFAHLDIPVLTLTGYFAQSEPAALYYFSQHQQYNPHADHTLLIGPYEEGAFERGPAQLLHGYEVDPVALIDLRELEYRWLDHVLKGAALPPQLSGRINYEVMGANEWRHAASLDAMAGGSQRLYLDAEPAGDAHRLGRSKSAKSAAIHQTISFTDRSDAGWMPPTDLISKSLVTHDALMFVGEPLSNPMELSGLISGRLDLAVNKMDLDLNIAIYEQLANGDYMRLFSPAFESRLSYAADRVHRHLLRAGERQQVSFKSERLTSRQLGKGSRLVMILRISKRPDREIDYGTGNDVSEESIADGKVPLKVRWYNDSYIEIPARAVAQTAR
jgi:putative CocE/NonD family hydrolase